MRSSAAILAEIRKKEAEKAKKERELAACLKLLAELQKISSDVSGCVSNLSGVYSCLERGLTNNGTVIGGDGVNERKGKLSSFNATTQSAIARVQSRIATLQAEIAALIAEIAALYQEYYAALAWEEEQRRKASEAYNNALFSHSSGKF